MVVGKKLPRCPGDVSPRVASHHHIDLALAGHPCFQAKGFESEYEQYVLRTRQARYSRHMHLFHCISLCGIAVKCRNACLRHSNSEPTPKRTVRASPPLLASAPVAPASAHVREDAKTEADGRRLHYSGNVCKSARTRHLEYKLGSLPWTTLMRHNHAPLGGAAKEARESFTEWNSRCQSLFRDLSAPSRACTGRREHIDDDLRYPLAGRDDVLSQSFPDYIPMRVMKGASRAHHLLFVWLCTLAALPPPAQSLEIDNDAVYAPRRLICCRAPARATTAHCLWTNRLV
ncbi:uncharacterized protein SCHCODRAFT_02597370 [Schizophyllum commune H4-8]|uniref:Uncharacterized protein n=1 Tax=Schizophyllum commune (strain H4-8 / FGSC 9210) TaxID=578458 RepID=D8PZ09_SCHCM|nr:uncharacterized protein SCHCODRAFT_02597370 [Schizophyllum commune H4-8]KAI5896181.1 hypothetical protein SCHCODRAFT_02597370 [Schizophyllum commune H4-8]